MPELQDSQDLVLQQLKVITRVLTLAHADAIEKELDKIASTVVRKKAWILIDGSRNASDIARHLGEPARTIQKFVAAAAASGFVDTSSGKSIRKLIEYVPSSWLELVDEGEAEPTPAAPSQMDPEAGTAESRLPEGDDSAREGDQNG